MPGPRRRDHHPQPSRRHCTSHGCSRVTRLTLPAAPYLHLFRRARTGGLRADRAGRRRRRSDHRIERLSRSRRASQPNCWSGRCTRRSAARVGADEQEPHCLNRKPRHASPDAAHDEDDSVDRPKATRTVRFWALPIVITLAVLAALAAFYLGGILQPMTNLRHFPVAILNEDAGPTGAQVVKGMLSAFRQRRLRRPGARTTTKPSNSWTTRRSTAIAVIPPNFSSKLTGLREERADTRAGRAAGHHRLDESAGGHPRAPASPARRCSAPSR